MYIPSNLENDCVWTNGNRGPAVPASENPGEHGWEKDERQESWLDCFIRFVPGEG